MRLKVHLSILLTGYLSGVASAATDFDHSHAEFAIVLDAVVSDEGLVDYASLKADPSMLDKYLDRLAGVSETRFNEWREPQRIAFLINLYNAATLRLIINHYPVKSIKDIGGFLNGPWDQPVMRLFGETMDLNTVEHKILRKDYAEPRIHFALVCAAKGCPPLRGEPYVASRLDEQLDDQAKQFLANAQKNRVAAGTRTVYLSPLFNWYGEDFEKKSGSVLAFLKSYWPGNPPAGYEQFRIRYTDYDWSLNEQGK